MIEEQRKGGDYIQPVGHDSQRQEFARSRSRRPRSAFPPTCSRWESWSIRRLVKPEDEPKSWEDLNDPKWKGQNPFRRHAPLGSGNTMFAILQKKIGPAFNEKLAEQKPVFSRDLRNDARRVARGEYPIYVPQIFAFASDLKGLPVKVIDAEGGRALRQMDSPC
jgi:iron(III) transport system substrate-binding protein